MVNIFSINSLSNLNLETYDDSNFYWMDDFYLNPDLVYGYITSIEPPIWKDWETPSYNMVYFEDRRHMLHHPDMSEVLNPLSQILGQTVYGEHNVVTNFTRFKKDKFNNYDTHYWWPHNDGGYNAIIYLNKDITEEFMGTHIYKPINLDVLNRHENEHYRPWTLKTDWEIMFSFKAKYNRIVIFDGKKYKHGMDISDDKFFGETLENAKFRINQVLFFQE
jgi:hypothetical protein